MHLATAHSWAQSLNCLVMIAGAFILSYWTKKSCIARLLHPCFFWIWFRGCFLSETAPQTVKEATLHCSEVTSCSR